MKQLASLRATMKQLHVNQFKLKIYISLIITIILIWFLQPIHAQEPNLPSEQLHLEEYACLASDPASFKNCLSEAQQIAVPFIKITAPIICEGRNDCNFEIKNTNSPLRLSPTNEGNKIIRRGDFGYTLLTIENSSNIELFGLSIEDEGNCACPQGTNCPPTVIIKNSADIKIDKLSLLNTRGLSISVADSHGASILNSTFKNSCTTALEIKSQNLTEGIRVEKNTFEGNAGSALIFQSVSIGNQSTILSNKFINNHSQGAYLNCAYPCTGPQVKIAGPTSALRFAANIVAGGANSPFDSLGLYSSGVEISGQDIKQTTLFCNEISQNRGSGIVQPPPFRNISNVSISENKIWGNGLDLNIPTVTADENNCFTKECTLSCSQ